MRSSTWFALAALLANACTTTDSETGEAQTSLSGETRYRDATTDHAGTPREPAAPSAQQASVRVIVKGAGDIPRIDPQCALDPAGRFEARYAGTLEIGDGVHAASFTRAAADIVTPSGCKIPELTVGVVTDVIVHAELQATTQNCEAYCEAHARAEAEQTCGASASAAQCRTSVETQTEASCQGTCTTERTKIVAEASLAGSLLGDIDAESLRAAALGKLAVDLTFDRSE